MPKTRKSPSHSKRSQKSTINFKRIGAYLFALLALIFLATHFLPKNKDQDLDSFRAQPFSRVHKFVRPRAKPFGVTPANVFSAYNLPVSGTGRGTIAIIDAYDNPKIESDLAKFTTTFGLRPCTAKNGCLEKYKMSNFMRVSGDWAIEESLDVQWAHAVAQNAKILLVEAKSNGGADLLSAVNYARNRRDVVAISMSWGGDEFASESAYENAFTSAYGATFFAASGDSGHGVSWPSSSKNVVAVGGTKLNFSGGSFISETAWSDGGGGISAYLSEPTYQTNFGLSIAGNKRGVPDVSYNADPESGYPVYNSVPYYGQKGWFQVGGTSAGAPQWAALRSISPNITNAKLYQKASTTGQTSLRDIIGGTNGSCGQVCSATSGYDFVTGLGSPTSSSF